jgi:hypothetical protein
MSLVDILNREKAERDTAYTNTSFNGTGVIHLKAIALVHSSWSYGLIRRHSVKARNIYNKLA